MRATVAAAALVAAVVASAAPALAQPSRTEVPEPPDGLALLTGIDAGGFHLGAALKAGDFRLDGTAGWYPIIATLTTDPFVDQDPSFEFASSFMFTGRARYLPIRVRRGSLGGLVAAMYNTVLGFGVNLGPEAEIYLRDTISLRVGVTLSIFPDGDEKILEEFNAEPGTEINYPFGGDVDFRGTIGAVIYL